MSTMDPDRPSPEDEPEEGGVQSDELAPELAPEARTTPSSRGARARPRQAGGVGKRRYVADWSAACRGCDGHATSSSSHPPTMRRPLSLYGRC